VSVALLVVDVQNDITRGPLTKPENLERYKAVVQKIVELRAWARDRKMPILYTRICFRPSYVDAHPASPAIRINGLREDLWGGAIVDELQPLPTEIVITKHRTSAFYNTDLEILLRGLKVDTLVVCGLATNRAVESTVRDCHNRDLEAIVVSDATASGSEELHQGSLRSIADWFGQVMTLDEVYRHFDLDAPRRRH
jgi:ureidoacrylate peracid hydrolase